MVAPDATNLTVPLDAYQQAAAAAIQAQAKAANLEEQLAALRRTQEVDLTKEDTQGKGRGDRDTLRNRDRDDSRGRGRSRSRERTRDYERRDGRGRDRDRTRSRDRSRPDRYRRTRSDSRDNWRLARAARQAREDARKIEDPSGPRPREPRATNAGGIDPAYVQPKDRPGGSQSALHPYQPIEGTLSRPGSSTGLTTGTIHIDAPDANPRTTQSRTSTGTAGPQTHLQGDQDRADEEEREAGVRAEEIYEAMESDEHRRSWAPPTINIVPNQRQYWMFGPTGEVDGIPWDQDSDYRRFFSEPPIDDMLRPQILQPGAITIQVMNANTRRCPDYPYQVERVPTPEKEPSPTYSTDPEEKEEGDLIETKDSDDADDRAPNPDFQGPPPPPGSTYLNQNVGDTGVHTPYSAQAADGWMTRPLNTTATPGLVTLSGTTATVPPSGSTLQTTLPGWGPSARNTGHGTRAAARAQSHATGTSEVTQTRSGGSEREGGDPSPGAGPPTIPATVNPVAQETGGITIAYTLTSVPTHHAPASSSDIPSHGPRTDTGVPPAAPGGTQDPFAGCGPDEESVDWNTQGEPVFQENTPQVPEPSPPPRPNRRPAGKAKGTKKKSNKKGR